MADEKTGKGKRVQVTVQQIVEVEDPRVPEQLAQAVAREGMQIRVERLSDKLVADQGRMMAGGNGCISNPGGPGC